MPLVGGFSSGATKEQIKQLLNEQDKSELILEIVQDLRSKLDKQGRLLTKLVSVISKMYHDGEINKDTFNKLDSFLKSYYDIESTEENI